MLPILKAFSFRKEDCINDSKYAIVCADLETTGLNTETCEIVEIAGYVHTPPKESEALYTQCLTNAYFSELVRPTDGKIPETANVIHGISENDVAYIPPFRTRMMQFITFLTAVKLAASADFVVLVFHNGFRFDLPVLRRECKNCNLKIPSWLLASDTLPMLDHVFIGKFGNSKGKKALSTLAALYAIKEPDHRALQDSKTLSCVLDALGKRVEVVEWLIANSQAFNVENQ